VLRKITLASLAGRLTVRPSGCTYEEVQALVFMTVSGFVGGYLGCTMQASKWAKWAVNATTLNRIDIGRLCSSNMLLAHAPVYASKPVRPYRLGFVTAGEPLFLNKTDQTCTTLGFVFAMLRLSARSSWSDVVAELARAGFFLPGPVVDGS
jgi:hypothetical protein